MNDYESVKEWYVVYINGIREQIKKATLLLVKSAYPIVEDFVKSLPDNYLDNANFEPLILYKNTIEINMNNLEYLTIFPDGFDPLEWYTILVHNQNTNRDYRLALYEFQDFE